MMESQNISITDEDDENINKKTPDTQSIVTIPSQTDNSKLTTIINLTAVDNADLASFSQAPSKQQTMSKTDQQEQQPLSETNLLAAAGSDNNQQRNYLTTTTGATRTLAPINNASLLSEANSIVTNTSALVSTTTTADHNEILPQLNKAPRKEADNRRQLRGPRTSSPVGLVEVKEAAQSQLASVFEGSPSAECNILRECRLDEDTITELKASSDIQSESSISIPTLPTPLPPLPATKQSLPPSSITIDDSIAQADKLDKLQTSQATHSAFLNTYTIPSSRTIPQSHASSLQDPKRVRFQSLLSTTPIGTPTLVPNTRGLSINKLANEDELVSNHKSSTKSTDTHHHQQATQSLSSNNCDNSPSTSAKEQIVLSDLARGTINNQIIEEEDGEEEEEFEETYSDEYVEDFQPRISSPYDKKKKKKKIEKKPTFRRGTSGGWYLGNTFKSFYDKINIFRSNSSSNNQFTVLKTFSSNQPYKPYEDKDLLTGASKYRGNGREKKFNINRVGRTFRGSYRYSRVQITMAIFKKFASLMIQKSTLALIGAFLIHITLGTVYTLSNINSYLTSYMREHGSPKATYGGSMWISSSYAVGQGFSMVLGGYIEKRFSARLACILGCILHSGSIMSTSWSVNHGPLAVLLTYGFLPGFGCGLAYMTPMSNGFGWYPNRKGLVAGVILAGFGIGTFIFNMAQTAYVNPDNLSPPEDANGYFTQHSILDRVPHLFVFIGTIYALMQFVGCCLLFKPPYSNFSSAMSGSKSNLIDNERPILIENEVSLRQAIRTREFMVLFMVYGITTQGVLFVNSMLKEYGQIFITSDMYLAWTGSMASIANSLGRLFWGLAIDRFSFTQCFTSITIIFGSLLFIMPFEFVLSSKLLYLLCTLGLFGSFSGWMSTYPVHLSRVFGRTNSGMIYGLIYISQSLGGIATAFGAHYLIDHYNRFVPFFCVVILEITGLAIYHLFYPK